jgi:Ca2+-transporting ATPase
VGLSLGSGTSVAKQASDMTLIDDSFRSITSAVMWGRSLYKNIQRFLFFQLVVNVTALLLVLAGSLIGTELPLTVTQILWVNLIMDTFAAMALASLPPSREVMNEKPRSQSDFIISRPMMQGILFEGIVFFLLMFAFLLHCLYDDSVVGVQRHELTLFFTTFVMIQVWNLFNAKTLGSNHSAFRYLWRNRGLLIVLVMIIAGQWLIVEYGGEMFRTDGMNWKEWTVVIAATSLVMWIGEAWRLFKRIWKKTR